MLNGIIIQREVNSKYRGVEGDNWYLNEFYPDILGNYFEEEIDKSWYDNDFVDVCSHYPFLELYIKLSRQNNIPSRLILCETSKAYPICNMDFYEKKFIGYDYAYAGGSYYSAVFSDVFSRRVECFSEIHLNEFGLFSDLQQLNQFIKERNEYKKKKPKSMFEEGEFVVYKLYEISFESIANINNRKILL